MKKWLAFFGFLIFTETFGLPLEGIIDTSWANFRKEPKNSSEILGIFKKGTKVTIFSAGHYYYGIKFSEEKTGFIYKKLVKKISRNKEAPLDSSKKLILQVTRKEPGIKIQRMEGKKHGESQKNIEPFFKNWRSTLFGAFLGSIFIPFVLWGIKSSIEFWKNSLPARKILGGFLNQKETCNIFIRDFSHDPNLTLTAFSHGRPYHVPGISKTWPDVEGIAALRIFNLLGRFKKTDNLNVLNMSNDGTGWTSNIFILGAQSPKCNDFYETMENVFYKIQGNELIDNASGETIKREGHFDYGIIIKVKNPHKTNGHAFLMGGIGTQGTGAASFFFQQNIQALGKEFGEKNFGIIVRVRWGLGDDTAERIKEFDKVS